MAPLYFLSAPAMLDYLSAAKVYGLSVRDPLWLATALESAANAHSWERGAIPPIYRTKLAELRRAAESFVWEADTLAIMFARNGVEGVEGVELPSEDEDDDCCEEP